MNMVSNLRGEFMGKRVVVVGTQWGDEGKGKVTDFLATQADVVVRSQGGNNAGHTILFNGKKFALHFLPSGILNPKITNYMTNGMVIEPQSFFKELEGLKKSDINDFCLFISDRAHVIMPYHLTLDGVLDELKGADAVGTTKKGIGPAYTDKVSRIGIRIGDLLNPIMLEQRLKAALKFTNAYLTALGQQTFHFDDLYPRYLEYGNRLKPYIADTSLLLNRDIDANKKILFEGAQGVMLCIEQGTYPFVTSSSPSAAAVPLNAGISPMALTDVIGVTKAYSTRVGGGVFPTEFEDEIAKTIREVGHEYGTTTGRPRRIGWLDIVVLKHTKRVSGLTGLAIMLLDVLSGLKNIKICTHYELDGKIIDYVPGNYADFVKVKPIYIELPGWTENITQVSRFSDLPMNAQQYLKTIEKLSGVNITLFSVGPDRTQTVVLKDIFE
jgi:adenylosuccinate synthase